VVAVTAIVDSPAIPPAGSAPAIGVLSLLTWTGSDSDCTGTATDDTASIHFYIVTVGGGKEFFGIETDIGATATIDGKKQ
jgi:hypothetical protein